jgi:hypothetical protein
MIDPYKLKDEASKMHEAASKMPPGEAMAYHRVADALWACAEREHRLSLLERAA